jgi:hypothetical protein
MEGQGGGEAQGVADPPKKLILYFKMPFNSESDLNRLLETTMTIKKVIRRILKRSYAN